MPTIVGLFESQTEAHAAVRRLQASGFRQDVIGVAMRDGSSDELATVSTYSDRRPQGAATGAVSGAGVGVLMGLALAGSTIAIPGVGGFLIGGPLAAALAGLGVGVASGGLLGALIGLGIPEAEAYHYAAGLEQGGVLVSVQASREHAGIARRILDQESARRTYET
ncbi:MAG TPA: hypothetical protein VGZ22_30275 [Isosphaeraceae bacterium]|jgi:hypothetical protein|nr:hypothetical protein [Isosphaeraceae bacterium]